MNSNEGRDEYICIPSLFYKRMKKEGGIICNFSGTLDI